jgi:pimeloyl-ACP methyl ester carboxylesterase
MWPLVGEVDVRAVLPAIRVPTLVVHHTDDPIVEPAKGRYVAENIPGAKYVELPGRNSPANGDSPLSPRLKN